MERWEKLIEEKMVDCFCVCAFEELCPVLPRGIACWVCVCVGVSTTVALQSQTYLHTSPIIIVVQGDQEEEEILFA